MEKTNTTRVAGEKRMSNGGMIVIFLVLVNAVVLYRGMINEQWYGALVVTIPALAIASWSVFQPKPVRTRRRARRMNMNKSLN